MAISLHLDEMSVEEKLQAMESLWEDLCSRGDSMASGGNDHFQDWEVAKQDIENTIS
ncbi:MAG: addiction module protein [Longimicrobiaceae bacterium]